MTSHPAPVVPNAMIPSSLASGRSFDKTAFPARDPTKVPAAPAENIKVVVRCRPLDKMEREKNCKVVVEVDSIDNCVTLFASTDRQSGDHQSKTFSFDHVFNEESTQAEVYNAVARPIVQNVLEGYNGTIFAYGQTGTGKTFTMEGDHDEPELKGIIPNSFEQIFNGIANAKEGQQFLVRCSYLEIYNENIRDLLSTDHTRVLELKENKDKVVYVKDLTDIVVHTAEDMNRVMKTGHRISMIKLCSKNSAFEMNMVSSRSHAIFSIVVEGSTEIGPNKGIIHMGKLNLVDLAGSERVSKTKASGDRLKEATKINLSLSSLGIVISALVDGNSYIPYRNSKLTRLLQDSLGGNAKTAMVATICPSDYNFDETLSTLRYANRAKNIKNCAKINEDPKDAVLRQYQEEILRLRALLEQKKQELQERSQQQPNLQLSSKSSKKKIQTVKLERESPVDHDLGALLEEQKRMEELHNDELRALLEPFGINVSRSPKGIMEELERRKAALMKDGEEVKEENKRLYDELGQTTKAMMNSKRQCKDLFQRVLSLEGQIQKSQMTHEELKTRERELAEQSLREETLRKTLEQKRMTSKDLKDELTKLQEEIEDKQKKSSRLSYKTGEHMEKMQMLRGDHQDKLKQLQNLRKELARELKLKKLIVDNFIPRKLRKEIEERIRYDETRDKYILVRRTDTTYEQPPVNRMLLNPYLNLTRFPRLPKQTNVYYSDENLLALEPEPPVPRSQALVLEEEDPAITSMIAETMRELNQELVIVCDHRKGRHHKTSF